MPSLNTVDQPSDEIRIGVSRCLMGEYVRYDGGHKRSAFVTETLAPFVRYIPVCPEVEMGMSTPREAIRLMRGEDGPRLIGLKTETDYTSDMREFAKVRAEELRNLDLHGYILKKDSPSCGLYRVRVYGTGGAPSRDGRGSFASALADSIPDLPMEEEGRLNDPALRENFIECVFAYQRLKAMFSGTWRTGDLVAFHTAEKFLLLAHDTKTYAELGRLVAGAKGTARKGVARDYRSLFMRALARPATTRKHTNVLQHMAGHLKKLLDADSKAELHQVIEDFRLGLVPLVVPVTLFRHFVRLHDVPYLANQTYLSPHPKELMLRNHV